VKPVPRTGKSSSSPTASTTKRPNVERRRIQIARIATTRIAPAPSAIPGDAEVSAQTFDCRRAHPLRHERERRLHHVRGERIERFRVMVALRSKEQLHEVREREREQRERPGIAQRAAHAVDARAQRAAAGERDPHDEDRGQEHRALVEPERDRERGECQHARRETRSARVPHERVERDELEAHAPRAADRRGPREALHVGKQREQEHRRRCIRAPRSRFAREQYTNAHETACNANANARARTAARSRPDPRRSARAPT
jgi:hypothetical protein